MRNLDKATKTELILLVDKLDKDMQKQQAEFDQREHDLQADVSRAERDIRYQDLVHYVKCHVGIDAIAEAMVEDGPPGNLSHLSEEDMHLFWQTVLNLRRLAYLMLLGS
jgi:hypothetical protein